MTKSFITNFFGIVSFAVAMSNSVGFCGFNELENESIVQKKIQNIAQYIPEVLTDLLTNKTVTIGKKYSEDLSLFKKNLEFSNILPQDLTVKNCPVVPVKLFPLIIKRHEEMKKEKEKPHTVAFIAEKLGMNVEDFIKTLKTLFENWNKHDSNGKLLPGIAPAYLQNGDKIETINKDTLLGHPINFSYYDHYRIVRDTYDQAQPENKDLKDVEIKNKELELKIKDLELKIKEQSK